jgi:hypothetical protein
LNHAQHEAVVRVLLEDGAASTEVFASIVSDYVDNNGPAKLAQELEVSSSTVMRWSRGSARPHPRIRQKIVDWIWEQAG